MRLYTEILNVAEQLGVRKQAKDYMDMHLAKIKDNGFKASEPGGSSDRNFEEQLKEVRSRIASEVEGYTDLHENDVALESFLGELNEEIEMVEPQSGHIFYKLNKDVTLKLKTGSTSPTYAPGVLLHPVFGKSIIAKEGQYIINFHGQLFYVDMDEKFATKVPKHEDSGNKESLSGALDIVDMAPKFNPGWKSYLNEPLEEAAKPEEKEIKALAAKLMKDPKYKARYKGKKGVEFVKTTMADAEKQLKGK